MTESLVDQAGAAIAATMAATGVSKSELARRLEVSPPAVSAALEPGHNLSLNTLDRYLAALGVSATLELEVVQS